MARTRDQNSDYRRRVIRSVIRGRQSLTPPSPRRQQYIQVLDRDVLRRRSIDTFPSAYATLLSIVLGIAFGTLAVTLIPLLSTRSGLLLATLITQSALAVVGLLVVFYNYVWFMLIFRWAPGVLDTLIPFSLGACVVAVSATVGNDLAWLGSFTALHFFGTLGYWHTLHRASPNMFRSQETYREVRRLLIFLVGMAFSGAPLGGVAILALGNWHSWAVLAFGVFVLLAAVAMTAASEVTLGRVYAAAGLVRLPLFSRAASRPTSRGPMEF